MPHTVRELCARVRERNERACAFAEFFRSHTCAVPRGINGVFRAARLYTTYAAMDISACAVVSGQVAIKRTARSSCPPQSTYLTENSSAFETYAELFAGTQ